ncbi:MAG: ABC transporter permease [Leptonema sp. (in: Bacteria)]|nr:ABC transporter permease [Leptonema sp. (in: bacteria)]
MILHLKRLVQVLSKPNYSLLFHQFTQLLLIHIREFYREPAVLFWSLAFPAALAIGLGIAFQNPTESTVKVGVVAEGLSIEVDSFKAQFDKPDLQNFKVELLDKKSADRALKRGELRLIVLLNGPKMIFQYDPSSPDAMREQALVRSVLLRSALGSKILPIQDEKLQLPGTRYIDYLVPGLLALGVLNACVWGIGWSLMSMRMKMLLRRMAASPMNQTLFFASFGVARIVLVFVEAGFLILVANLFFDLKPVGSYFSIAIMILSGVICFGGLAVFIASRTANTQVGNGLINAAVFPMMLFSGIFFSYHGFPQWLHPLIKILPLTILADSIRVIYLEGEGILSSLFSMILLVTSGALLFYFGRRLFRWS